MAKYSTGSGGGGGSGDACELCGREDTTLSRANVAGADLQVCSDCAPHDDTARRGGGNGGSGGSSGGRGDEPSRKERAARNVARTMDAAAGGDSRRWEEEGTDYEDDRLPYLVSGYGEVATEARREAGLTAEELAAELGVEVEEIDAVEEGRAARADVGGSTVRAIEKELDATLVDE